MTPPLTTGILLADDHRVVRDGLRMILDAEPDLRVVAEAADGVEALDRGTADDVDLAVLDVSMPRLTGLQVARELRRRRPDVRVLILSMHGNEEYCLEAVRLGASGYVLKTVADRDLVSACRACMRGERFVCPDDVRSLVDEWLGGAADDGPPEVLTARESEVLKLVAEGHTTREIAETLVISEKTVDRHRANLLEKLGMRDRVDLTRYAIRRGLVEP